MNAIPRALAVCIAVALAVTVCAAEPDLPARARFALGETRFAEGIKLASSDRDGAARAFRDAAAAWRSLRDGAVPGSGLHNAALETNIGNASLLADDLGRAITAYRRALDIDPTSVAARAGLAEARRRAGTPTTPVAPTLAAFGPFADMVVSRATPGVLLGVGASLYIAGWALVAMQVFRGTRTAGLGLCAILASLVVLSPLALTLLGGADVGVVTDSVLARQGPDDSIYGPAFDKPLPAGAEVRALETRGSWARVSMVDGREAWVPITAIERIARE